MNISCGQYLKPITIVLLVGQGVSPSWAAGVDAGQLLNEQRRTQPQQKPKLDTVEPESVELKFDDLKAANQVNVQRIEFQNADNLSSETQLQKWVSNAIDKSLTFAQLQKLADHLTTQLRAAGYLLARAYLPKQDVTEGVLRITIAAGQLSDKDGITISGKDLRINELQLQDILEQNIKKGQAINKATLERSLLLMSDLPGIKAHASLAPGQAPGTSKLTINASEGPLLNGALWTDNYGNRYTGTWRGNGMLNINDPLKIGDQLRLSMTGSEGIFLGSARYALPLMANGLSMDVHYSNLQYQIGRELSNAQLEGEAYTAGTSLYYPLIRSREFSLNASAGYEHRGLRDKGAKNITSDRHIDEAVLGLSANSLDNWLGGGINNAQIGLAAGNLDRSDDEDDLAADRHDAKTQGGFAKFTYSLARLQKISQQLSLFGSINGQQASGNLDSSEKFILGGPSGVRAYPIGEGSGDHGWVINTELRWDLPYTLPIGNLQLVGFVDTGHITMHDQVWAGAITNRSGKNSYQLSGGGISLNLTEHNLYQISGTWAAPIGSNPGRSSQDSDADGKQDDHRFWLQAMVWF